MNLYYHGLTVQAWSSDPSDLDWLREFLCPFFEIIGEGRYDCRVALIADDRRFEETFNMGSRPDGAEIDCFALESSWIRLPLWKSLSDEQVIFDKEHRVFYHISPDRREIEILTATGNRDSRIALMRVVREFAMTHSAQTHGLFVHGAAFSVGDRCVIVAGPKRAGKTTLLMHALRLREPRFVSNDRVLVLLSEAGVVARGMPTIVTIRQESLEKFPDLHCRLQTTSYDYTFSLNERTDRTTRPDRESRFSLSPAQFCQFFNVSSLAQGQVGALVFPQLCAINGRIELELLSFDVAIGRLRLALFRAHSSQKRANLFTFDHSREPDEATLEKLCLRLISQVPCFDCHLGPDVYVDPASATTLFSLAR